MAKKHVLGDNKTEIEIVLDDDLTNKSIHKWFIQKPDESTFEITEPTCVIRDVITGTVYILCDKAQFDLRGIYTIHVYILFADLSEFYSDPYEHRVWALYEV
ncbi:MAG: hypothetical protein ACTSPK_00195 [Candidatus Heimdallarchaeota archaeon]